MWDVIEQQRKVSLAIAAIPFSFLWFFVWGPTFEIMPEEGITFFILYGALKNIFLISWLFTIFGYSRKLFVKSNKLLIYSTEAVYPLYILHQTVMITLGYYIIQMQLSILVKFVLVVVSTFGGSLLIYELLIKRIGFMRVLFGLKPRT